MQTEQAWMDYGTTAHDYERIWARRFSPAAAALVAHAKVEAAQRVLDVATGTGIAAAAAAEAVGGDGTVVGADVSAEMLHIGAEARPGLRVRAEVLDLPFADGTFDTVLCSFGLHLFTKHQTALFDMLRVTRPDGTLAVATWGSGFDEYQRTWRELVAFTIGDQMEKSIDLRSAPGSTKLATVAGLTEALHEAGLRKLRIEPFELRVVYTLDDYVDGLSISRMGRFVHQMLGDAGFQSFMDRVRGAFRQRFPDPLQDFNQVLLAAGIRER